MQTAARYKAISELMEKIFADKEPADNIINAYFRERRYIGSGDRRFISNKIWEIIRHRSRLEFEAGSADIRKMLLVFTGGEDCQTIFAGGKYGLPELSEDEKLWLADRAEDVAYPPHIEAECPQWIFDKVQNVNLLKALNQPATADFRVNVENRDAVLTQLQDEGFLLRKTPYSPFGIRSDERINLNNCMAYQEGLIEVQDEASQLVSLLCDVQPEHKTIDYCCGAGGKSLAIAFLLQGMGMIEAHDIDAARLEQLYPRMKRLGIKNIKAVATSEAGNAYDRFIIDAPCSGSGTWRRSPDAKYRLTPQRLAEICKIQENILESAYANVKPGGRLIYITCSILPEENEDNAIRFGNRHPDMHPVDLRELWQKKVGVRYPAANPMMLRLDPLTSGTDGFFMAVWQKAAPVDNCASAG